MNYIKNIIWIFVWLMFWYKFHNIYVFVSPLPPVRAIISTEQPLLLSRVILFNEIEIKYGK